MWPPFHSDSLREVAHFPGGNDLAARPMKNPRMTIITERNVSSAAIIADHLSTDYRGVFRKGRGSVRHKYSPIITCTQRASLIRNASINRASPLLSYKFY